MIAPPKRRSIYPAEPSSIGLRIHLNFIRTASTQMLTITAVAVAAAWVPLLSLCSIRGGSTLLSFVKDYATHSRFLIVLPILILAEPALQSRLTQVAHQIQTDIVADDQRELFEAIWTSHDKLRNSNVARIVIVILTCATAGWLSQYLNLRGSEFVSWWRGGGGFKSFSPAGTWGFFVSYPILLYATYLWLWRHLLWARFLRSVAQLNLHLVAAHPDHVGGLGFLEASMLGQLPFSFCLGVGLAGAIANRVLNEGYRLFVFRFLILLLVVVTLLVCIAPYLFFTGTLMRMRRRGMSHYGAFARAVGEQFEKKWLQQTNTLTEDVLSVPDFSTTADLYGVVSNIGKINVVPVGASDVYAVVVFALLPLLPVVIAAIPFDTVMDTAAKLLF